MEIVWKDIKGYEGLYQISNTGEVKSLAKSWISGRHNMVRSKSDTIMVLQADRCGYFYVGLNKDGRRLAYKVHRLVAQAFIPNPFNYQQINHISGFKKDNKVGNLEWCNASHNIRHSIENGLQRPKSGDNHWNTKIPDSEIINIRKSNLTNQELATKYLVSKHHISSIKTSNKRFITR